MGPLFGRSTPLLLTRHILPNAMVLSPELAADLEQQLAGELRVDSVSRLLYSTDASIYQVMPLGVVFPQHADDLGVLVEFAAEHRLPLLARGGGTSLEGQTVNDALVIDCSRYLNNVIEVNKEERWARVQPGVVQDQLNRAVAAEGLKFGPDTATAGRATLGGMIGNNSAGAHSIVYGKTIDHVLELHCLLADGTEATFGPLTPRQLQAKQQLEGGLGAIYRSIPALLERHRHEIESRFPKVMRHVSGYNLDALVAGDAFDLARLIVGSEGTLATIVEAKVQLVPRPPATALGVAQFDDLVQAMEATRHIVDTGPSAVEIIDHLVISQARSHPTLSKLCSFVEGDPVAVLITEYSGSSAAEVEDRVNGLERLLGQQGFRSRFHGAFTPEAQAAVWQIRKSGLSLMLALKGDAKPIAFVEDTAVEVDQLPEYVQRLQQIVEQHDTWAGLYGHASVGCLHFRPVINLKETQDIRKLRSIAEAVRDLVMEFDGALSGEHGDGRSRTEFLPHFYGEGLYGAFREIKTLFDPQDRLNPGNICLPLSSSEQQRASYRLDEHLRYGPEYGARVGGEYLDWSHEGGFDRAVELCNGNGHCRKTDSGTMCPSYMATRDEEHSTRGRANALRAAISGVLPVEAFSSERLYRVLDLCLECKGCKGECPSNVDMAKIKYEFLAQYYEANGTPLRARVFGDIARISRWGSRLAPLSNRFLGSLVGRWLNEKLLGVSRKRPMPAFSRRTFEQWFRHHNERRRRHRPESGQPGNDHVSVAPRGKVVLFHDTFMNYNSPSVGIAAVRVLEAAGYEVLLVEKSCCGRPMMSNGLVESARSCARDNLARLAPFVRQGIPIVGCEPSCLLMLRDDYFDLLPGDPRVEEVSSRCFLIEEFLADEACGSMPVVQSTTGLAAADGTIPATDTPEQGFGSAPLGLRLRPRSRSLLVHGHCHQKASIGMEATLAILEWVPGYQPQLVDSGCCGMAGSFGYKAEHYDVSLAIGERVLFPAVRQHPDCGVAVSGISCKQQVSHATGREARHPIEWLADALEPGEASG